jgi:gliding motility-associated-like protein
VSNPSPFYKNYFLGKDESKWKSALYSVKKTKLKNFANKIDWILEGKDAELEYSFVVYPGADLGDLRSEFKGANELTLLENGNLQVIHDFGFFLESKPIAWQIINDKRVEVTCSFVLNENLLDYKIGDFDKNEILYIDPSLTFSSFSGSTADNWGSTATPDADGNVYGGGIVFGVGFPTVFGTYDDSFNGGSFDVSILKFNATGSNLMYGTYLGGQGNEFPSSMVVNSLGELYVLGLTSSLNFPTPGGFDITFGGGSSFTEYFLAYGNGSDIFVSHFSKNGQSLLNSTYLGGSGNDGVNRGALNYNYGDSYRGEIILDDADNVYLASSSSSIDYPKVGAGGQNMQGSQSAVVTMLNADLSNVLWSRYLSGTGIDAGYSLQVATNGEVYVAGGTTSNNLPVTNGNQMVNAGNGDGFVVRLNGTNGAILSGTYVGQFNYDQVYFVQLDVANEVYVLGQTSNNYVISSGKYGNQNSGQFIRKYSSNLLNKLWTTSIGAGTGAPEISPTAFLVSNCYEIYLSGWGGTVNSSNSQATSSSTNGFPTSSNAYQSSTNGSNFYLAVLSKDAQALKYATFFGGVASSANHVDGGTSRFDKGGNIYHTVCAACSGNANGFTTTPGAWSETNNSQNCNIAVFKFALGAIQALAGIIDPILCIGQPVVFSNYTQNGNIYHWDFGDGNTSSQNSPTHLYAASGTYDVTFIVEDSTGCYVSDTANFTIEVGAFSGSVIQPTDSICSGEPYQFQADGGKFYEWSPAQFLDDATIKNPTATITTSTQFTVIISDSCGADTLTVDLNVFVETTNATGDTTLCHPFGSSMEATGGVSYLWSPAIYLDDQTSSTPNALPDSTTIYTVEITTINGCKYEHQVTLKVFYDSPIPDLQDSLYLCRFTTGTVSITGADSYLWYPNMDINTTIGPIVQISTLEDRYYYCELSNACGTITDSLFVSVRQPDVEVYNDTIVCQDEAVQFLAEGGEYYSWSPTYLFGANSSGSASGIAKKQETIRVVGFDQYNCSDTAFALLSLHPFASVQVPTSMYAISGEVIELKAVGNGHGGTYIWSPSYGLSCVNCEITMANPGGDFQYFVEYTDQNGCKATNSLEIKYSPLIFVPNTFTPDDDDYNQLFKVVHSNISGFHLQIYNRWGRLIHTMDENSNGWDGRFNEKICPDGAYTWKMNYVDKKQQKHSLNGHLILLK